MEHVPQLRVLLNFAIGQEQFIDGPCGSKREQLCVSYWLWAEPHKGSLSNAKRHPLFY